ncbi:DUF503 domain-containing protein [Chloroflexota bacterium]
MDIGVCSIHIRMPENGSLKDKRRVVKSITARLSNKYNVSVAEVGDNDTWQKATIGVCCVSNDTRFNNSVLSGIVEFVQHGNFDMEFIDYEIEMISV